MAKYDHKFRTPGKGAVGGGYMRPRFQIGFEPEQIEVIGRLAEDGNRSFAATVRALVDIGLAACGADRAMPHPNNTESKP